MAYDPRLGYDPNPATPANNGGRGQPGTQPTTTQAAPAPAVQAQPRPSQEQIAALARQGLTYRYNSQTGAWDTVPMNNSEKSSFVDTQVNQPPPAFTDPSVPGASSQQDQAPQTPAQRVAGTAGTPRDVSGFTAPPTAGTQTPTAGARSTPAAYRQFDQGAGPGGVAGAQPGASVDYSRYDKAAGLYQQSIDTFQGELARLSGVDPFGNQAFLRKATDRAVGQAQALASGGLSTATARAGNMRQAQGVQASLAAQGIEQQAVQRNQDEVQAGQLRSQNATGLANTIGQQAQNEVQLAQTQTQAGMANLDAAMKKYGIDQQLNQQDVESLRNVNVELQKLGEQARETDVDALIKKYGIDEQTYTALKEIAAKGKLTLKDVVGGVFTAGAGLLGNEAVVKSDRRAKFDVRDPDLRDLEDYLGRTKGKLYRYKQPTAPGQRAGLNYGPMAQALQKSKIGRTVVVDRGEDGLYVDTGRLALADHAALAALAAEVKALKGGK